MVNDGIPPDQWNEILELLRQRKKIQAIKIYREATGKSLLQSKEAVEQMAQSGDIVEQSVDLARRGVEPGKRPEHEPSDPFAKKRSGCSVKFALLGLGIVLLWIAA